MSTKTVPTVYQSSKTVKQQKWPLVYQSSHVYAESTEYTKSALHVHVHVAEYTKPFAESELQLFTLWAVLAL